MVPDYIRRFLGCMGDLPQPNRLSITKSNSRVKTKIAWDTYGLILVVLEEYPSDDFCYFHPKDDVSEPDMIIICSHHHLTGTRVVDMMRAVMITKR